MVSGHDNSIPRRPGRGEEVVENPGAAEVAFRIEQGYLAVKPRVAPGEDDMDALDPQPAEIGDCMGHQEEAGQFGAEAVGACVGRGGPTLSDIAHGQIGEPGLEGILAARDGLVPALGSARRDASSRLSTGRVPQRAHSGGEELALTSGPAGPIARSTVGAWVNDGEGPAR